MYPSKQCENSKELTELDYYPHFLPQALVLLLLLFQLQKLDSLYVVAVTFNITWPMKTLYSPSNCNCFQKYSHFVHFYHMASDPSVRARKHTPNSTYGYLCWYFREAESSGQGHSFSRPGGRPWRKQMVSLQGLWTARTSLIFLSHPPKCGAAPESVIGLVQISEAVSGQLRAMLWRSPCSTL